MSREDLTSALKPDSQGKVRDLYDLGDTLLLVATDRISAFDYVLPDEIPQKGIVLTQLSKFWFDHFGETVPNHLISTDVADLPERFQPFADYLNNRIMLVRKAQMFPVECIVRGYLSGSALKEYQATGQVCSQPLPAGLSDGSQLPEPLFTPSTKAELGDHDENITFCACADLIGLTAAEALRDLSLKIYSEAAAWAYDRGIIIADTKFEFGVIDGTIVLADEVLTPDSSRFWPKDGYAPGQSQPSFDKQFVRDWLNAHWDRQGTPPHLPLDIIEKTSEKYRYAYEALVGKPLEIVR